MRESTINPFVPRQYKQPSVFDAYGGSIGQTGSDYDELMNNYRRLLTGGSSQGSSPIQSAYNNSNPMNYTPITPTTVNNPEKINFNPTQIPPSILYNPVAQSTPTNFTPTATPNTVNYTPTSVQLSTYHQDPNSAAAIANLKGLADTGGISAEEQAAIRERGTSPIRAIYANAQQGLSRQRALSGGYSPNSSALTAKMARELAGQVGQTSSNINAGLAEQIAANKLSASPQLANAIAQEEAAKNTFNQRNTDIMNQVAQANTAGALDTAKFNTTARTNVDLANTVGQTDVNKFNTNNINRVNELNTQGQLDTNKFNTNLAAQIAQANQQGQTGVNQANAAAQNQVNLANAVAANQAAGANATNMIDVNKFNAGIGQQNIQNQLAQQQLAQQGQLGALSGMTSLYGTTPALASTFGNQALQQQQLQQQAAISGLLPIGSGYGGIKSQVGKY